jgi:predicted permease
MQEELESLRAMAEGNELGNMTLIAEDARSQFTWTWIEQLGQDLRYATRSMAHNKAFTVLAVMSLALGIGANTAIYSFVDSILLRSLPVPNPEELVVMKWQAKSYTLATSGMSWSTSGSHYDPAEGTLSSIFPYPALKVFQDNENVIENAFCYFSEDSLTVTVREGSEAVKGQYVSGNYFQGMGVPPSAGRLIQESDDESGAASVAVLSHRFAQRHFRDASASVGETVRINNNPFTVIGVAPPGFFGAEPGSVPDIYVPMRADAVIQRLNRPDAHYLDANFYWIEIMARLKPGVNTAQAQAVLSPQFHRFVESTIKNEKQREDLPVLRIQEGATGLDSLRQAYSKPVYFLMAMVGLILVIACANIANLLLARAMARRREIAVRLSIGAGRARVIRQLLTESVLLSAIGGTLGVILAAWGIRVMTLLLANGRENFTLHAELNWTVLGLTLALSILTGLLFGLAPALQAARVDVVPALKEVPAGTMHRRWRAVNLSRILVVTQISLSLLLLVAAGLFGRTLAKLHSIELGFNRENILLFSIRPGAVGYQGQELRLLYVDLRERLLQVPGVRGVTISRAPLPMGGGTASPITISGAPAPAGRDGRPFTAALGDVGPSFFTTMQIPITAGRDFNERDETGAPPVAIVNRRLAKAFGLDNPIGRTLVQANRQYEIVGLVEDALIFMLKEETRPIVYFSSLQRQRPLDQMSYEVRVAGDPLKYAAIVRQIVREADSRIAVFDVKTQAAHLDQSISSQITLARLCTAFAALALIIACVGLYGTVTFSVERRTSEFGIRMTLGAQAGSVLWMVLREVFVMAVLGLAIGVPVVLAGSRYVKSLLYEIEPNDPWAITLAIATLLASGLLAGFVPARRASRIDPMIALRHD